MRSRFSSSTLHRIGGPAPAGGSSIGWILPFRRRAVIVAGPQRLGKSIPAAAIAGPAAARRGRADAGRRGRRDRAGLHSSAIPGMKPSLTVCGKPGFLGLIPWRAAHRPRPVSDALSPPSASPCTRHPCRPTCRPEEATAALARLSVAHRSGWTSRPRAGCALPHRMRAGAVMAEHRAGGGMVIAPTHAPVGLEGAANRSGRHERPQALPHRARSRHCPPHRRRAARWASFPAGPDDHRALRHWPDLNLLRRIGPAILWIAALLAMLLGLDGCSRPISRTDRSDQFTARPRRWSSRPRQRPGHWMTGPAAGRRCATARGFDGDRIAGPCSASDFAAGRHAGAHASAHPAATVSLRRRLRTLARLVLPLCVPALFFGVRRPPPFSGEPSLRPPLAILGRLRRWSRRPLPGLARRPADRRIKLGQAGIDCWP